MKCKKILAFYIRLSQEDMVKTSGVVDESASVSNQRDLLRYTYQRQSELSEYEVTEYVDDGYSGTNFNRPGFQKMMKDVKSGKVHCIMVKDFSRFARNFLDAGEYLEQIFPFLGVRFISVNDHYDSDVTENTAGDWDVAFKNFLYDLYSKDLSQKVSVAKRAKAKKGEYLGRAPIGYMRSKQIKNHLEIEPEGARIVRTIFDMALQGNTIPIIVKTLNKEKVPTPGIICERTQKSKVRSKNKTIICWRYEMVWSILKNRVYTGACINFKRSKIVPCGVQSKKNTEDEQVIIPNCHEAIVTEQEFNEAFEKCKIVKHERKKKWSHDGNTVLKGTVICGYCNCAMKYASRTTMPDIFLCYTTRGAELTLTDEICDCRGHEVKILENMVLNGIKKMAQLADKKYRRIQENQGSQREENGLLEKEIGKLNHFLRQKKMEKQDCYELYIMGNTDKSKYMEVKKKCDQAIIELEERIVELNRQIDEHVAVGNADMQVLKNISAYEKDTILTKEMVKYMVKEIKVYRDNRYEIKWNFADYLQE